MHRAGQACGILDQRFPQLYLDLGRLKRQPWSVYSAVIPARCFPSQDGLIFVQKLKTYAAGSSRVRRNYY